MGTVRMANTRTATIEVFRAFEGDRVWQIGLSAEQVQRLCHEAGSPGWRIESCIEHVTTAEGLVIDWSKHGGCGGEHVHWVCPLCGEEHMTDFEPHAESNPALWFCERGRGICLVSWRYEEVG